MTTWLGLTAKQVDLEYFGDCASQYHSLITAHRLTLRQAAAESNGVTFGGQITSVKEGPASASFQAADLSEMDQDLARTVYGQMAWELRCNIDVEFAFGIARSEVL